MSWYGNTNLILVQPQPGFFHNSELLSKSVKVVVPAWKEGMMVSIWENRRPATNLNNTLRLVFQPHLGTCGSHGLESWLGLKSLSFLSDVFMSKNSLYLAVFLSYFICIYIYIIHVCCMSFDLYMSEVFWYIVRPILGVAAFRFHCQWRRSWFSISFLSLFHFSSSWCLSWIQLLVILAFTSVSGAAVFIIFPSLPTEYLSVLQLKSKII